jgi:hypothetical protein
MSEQTHSLREDLAFMRAIAEDGDPLPWTFGAHLFTPGVLFAPCAFLAWAALSGLADVPSFLLEWAWAPLMLLYVPVWFLISRADRGVRWGPSKRAFAAAWTAMALMTFVGLACISTASMRLEAPLMLFWPSIALTLYAGAWTMIAMAHQRGLYWVIALGGFATAIVCAVLIDTPTQWLIFGLGILAWLAAPGLYIILRARAAKA